MGRDSEENGGILRMGRMGKNKEELGENEETGEIRKNKRKMLEKWEDKREWRRMAEHGEE